MASFVHPVFASGSIPLVLRVEGATESPPVEVPRVPFSDIAEPTERGESALLRQAVMAARAAQLERADKLNARLDEPLPMNRFRPNIVLEGAGPFAEDGWTRVRIGAIELDMAGPCARCATTTTDQETGARGVEPLRTLATFRREGAEVMFGQNANHRGTGEIAVGMPVEVLERR